VLGDKSAEDVPDAGDLAVVAAEEQALLDSEPSAVVRTPATHRRPAARSAVGWTNLIISVIQ
jgi:hypothetical protein